MLHDYWMYRPDTAVVTEHLPGTRTVLDWFARYEQPDGLLKKLPWWSFVDWVVGGELPNYDEHDESCTTTLQYLGALQDAAKMEKAVGDAERGGHYATRAGHVRSGLREKCWDAGHGLMADNPGRKDFSQQTNVLGVLFDVVPKEQQPAVLRKMLAIEPGTHPDGVLGASYYFRFYLARALDHAGMGDEYLASLKPWLELLPLHFSTWPEIPGDTRSDSHAWSAHPAYDLMTLVAGVEPSAPGFSAVRVAPHLGELTSVSASYPHPLGPIAVQVERSSEAIHGCVTLPAGLSGTFVWRGKTIALHPGVNQVQVD
jgi:alpha-L-rhamnosidase